MKNVELPFIGFGNNATATDNFSEENMLGQGGFGKVYKGMLGHNIEVAIKRLGQGSGQGAQEFRKRSCSECKAIAQKPRSTYWTVHRQRCEVVGLRILTKQKLGFRYLWQQHLL